MKKLLSATIAVGILTTLSLAPAKADVAAGALPVLNNAQNASVTTGTNHDMNISIGNNQQGAVGVLNWNSFNVGKDASVNYEFTAHNQTALNQVAASGGLSQIYGKITDSSISCGTDCGYNGTGKIILLNPNGVLFGDGANVNVNSFTVSNMDGTFNKDTNKLELTKGLNQKDFGIKVLEGAKIYGDKNVAFAADNISVYKGSQISTNTGINVGDTAYGKVKLVTADGVNFEYYNNGAVKAIDGVKTAAALSNLNVNGDIKSGNIDIRNYSTNSESELNLNNATLKATKATKGNDGNIWLIAPNKVITENTKLTTVNMNGAENAQGGNVVVTAGNKASVATTDINAVGDVKITGQNGDAVVEGGVISTPKDVIITAGKTASVQKGAKIAANNVTVTGNNAWASDSAITAAKDIKFDAKGNNVALGNTTLKANKVTLTAKNDVKGNADVQNGELAMYAGNDVNIKLANVGNKAKGVTAEAGKNVTITTDGTLSVSRLVAKTGDMTINADKVIAGLPYTNEAKIPGDDSPRSYIYVEHGKFTSNTAHDAFEVTASDTLNAAGDAQLRHHIQYGNGNEKILLINPRPYVAPEPTPEPTPAIVNLDEDQASMLNKLPRQPELANRATSIANNKTALVDVFAAASQIEIEDDEEE